jgi:hypothetical protein
MAFEMAAMMHAAAQQEQNAHPKPTKSGSMWLFLARWFAPTFWLAFP